MDFQGGDSFLQDFGIVPKIPVVKKYFCNDTLIKHTPCERWSILYVFQKTCSLLERTHGKEQTRRTGQGIGMSRPGMSSILNDTVYIVERFHNAISYCYWIVNVD